MTPAGSVYCERTTDGLAAEPLNAVTNIAFLVSAGWSWRAYRRLHHSPRASPDLAALPILAACIGLGSFAWHTVATPWAALADVLPIQIWITVFLASTCMRLLALGPWATALVVTGFQILSLGLPLLVPMRLLNGSVAYAPAWTLLVLLTTALAVRGSGAAGAYARAAVLFSVSLVARSVDQWLCASLPQGTHFLWHLANAVVLHVLATALASAGGPPRKPPLVRAAQG